jgi:hypothetical protein
MLPEIDRYRIRRTLSAGLVTAVLAGVIAPLALVPIAAPAAAADTDSGTVTVTVAPTATSVAPSGGTAAGGTPITIAGTGFASGSTVTVGGVPATDVTVVNDTTITARTPLRPVGQRTGGTVPVVVENSAGATDGSTLFTYVTLAVTSVSPVSGSAAGGTPITITGSGFDPNGTVSVLVGDVEVVPSSVTETTVTVTIPTRTGDGRTVGAVPLSVKVDGESSNNDVTFTYRPVLAESGTTQVRLHDLASRSQRRSIVRTTTAPFIVTGTDSRTGLPYEYVTDHNYGNSGAYRFESFEGMGSTFTRQTVAAGTRPLGASGPKVGTDAEDLTALAFSGGGCGASGGNFCSGFGPEVYSEPFFATQGQSLSFDWWAQRVSDDYEVYAFLVRVDSWDPYTDPAYPALVANTNSSLQRGTAHPRYAEYLGLHTLVMHSLGKQPTTLQRASVAVPASGLYRFRFVNGSYDFTGGAAIGSRMFIGNRVLVGQTNLIQIPTMSDQVKSGSTYAPYVFEVSSTSGAPVAVTAGGACTVSTTHAAPMTTVTVTKTGTSDNVACTLTYSQDASGTFAPAPTITSGFTWRSSAVVPPAPTITSVVARDGALSVGFLPPAGDGGAPITNYQYSINNGSSWITVDPATTTSPILIPGLTNGTAYPVRLRAVNSVGGGAQSVSVSGSPVAPGVPSAPGSLLVVAGEGAITVSFAVPADGGSPITRYEYTLDGGATWIAPSPAIASSPFTIGGLTNGTSYGVGVRAVNIIGAGTASTIATVMPQALPPAAPSALALTPSSGALEVAFTPPSDGGSPITGYEYSLDGGTTWVSVAQDTPGSPFTITGLTDGVAQTVRVRAVNGVGTGPASTPATATPQLGAPTDVVLTASSGAIGVAFTPPADGGNPITGYEYSLDDGATWVAVAQDTPGSPFTISGLPNGVAQSVRVRAVNADMAGLPSTPATATPVAPPVSPTPEPAASGAPDPTAGVVTGSPRPAPRPVSRTVPRSPILDGGRAPRPTFAPTLRVDDEVVAPVVTPVGVIRSVGGATTSTGTTIAAGPLALILDVRSGDGEVRTSPGGTPQLSVVRDRAVRVSGGGLAPGSEVRVWLPLDGADARPVAVLRTGPDGTFEGELAFDARLDRAVDRRPFPIGRHVLQLVGRDADGRLVILEKTVQIRQPEPMPERDRSTDVLPRASVGAASATRAGLPQEVRVVPDTERRAARVEGEGWRIAISLATGAGAVQSSGLGGARVEIVIDETAEVTGDGFQPGTRADVWLFSDPVLLGSYQVGIDGTFRGDAPVSGVPIGEHTLQLQGIGEDGFVRAANLGVVVLPRPIPVDLPGPTETVTIVTAAQSPPGRATPWTAIVLIGITVLVLLSRSRIEYVIEGADGQVGATTGMPGRRVVLPGAGLTAPDGRVLIGWSPDERAVHPTFVPGEAIRLSRGTTVLHPVWGTAEMHIDA